MEKIKVILCYPGGVDLKNKELLLTQTELTGMLMSNRVLSGDNCFIIESKVFHDTKDGKVEIKIVLGDCY